MKKIFFCQRYLIFISYVTQKHASPFGDTDVMLCMIYAPMYRYVRCLRDEVGFRRERTLSVGNVKGDNGTMPCTTKSKFEFRIMPSR